MSIVNYLHYLLHRPEKGWDPVPLEHVEMYCQVQWDDFHQNKVHPVVDLLGSRIGGLEGKRVLDLGGGPGHYSVAFAQRGAKVTWHDVSYRYRNIAQQWAEKLDVNVDFSLGYMEETKKFIDTPFDLVFVRGCWFCCIHDPDFAKLVYQLVKPGGAGYVDSPHFDIEGKWILQLKYNLNKYLWFKLGHPHPPPGRIARLIDACGVDHMILDYSSGENDKVFFIKPKIKSLNLDESQVLTAV
jgi:SAM-dependent methyltransferase